MTSQVNTPTEFQSFHTNKSLLFQFIVYEFLSAYEEISYLKQLVNEIDRQDTPGHLEILSSHITKLSGPFDEYKKHFLWNFDKGMLTKLKRYCQALSQTNIPNTRDIIVMEDNINKALLYCLHGLDSLSSLQDQDPLTQKTKWMKPLLKILDKVSGYLLKISGIILEFVPIFRNDENVLFFLLKNHKKMSKVYSARVTVKLFGKMFPKGLPELENFLYLRFKKRGFHLLLPVISQKISEVKHSYA